jgi:hypothetical protein
MTPPLKEYKRGTDQRIINFSAKKIIL